MTSYLEIAAYLDTLLQASLYAHIENTRYCVSSRPVSRLGLALEAYPTLPDWVNTHELDAVFLHRPWRSDLAQLPGDMGVLMSHVPFDAHMTIGDNPRLIETLGLTAVEPFGSKDDKPLGISGACDPIPFADILSHLTGVLGGVEALQGGHDHIVTHIAAVSAMNDTLVRDAARLGADLYLTGQMRQPAKAAVEETGIAVIAVGHQRSEEWGLRCLASLLRGAFSGLEVIVWGEG